MCPAKAKQLATALPSNIKYLATLIARKPNNFTKQWAATTDEAFSLYTRTSTVDLILSVNNILAESDWPFPSFLNLRTELQVNTRGNLLARLVGELGQDDVKSRRHLDDSMVGIFKRHQSSIFDYWASISFLKGKQSILRGVRDTYRRGLFSACMPTLLPLLDFVMRDYFESNRFEVSLKTLVQGFEKAAILPHHLKPGFAIWDATKNPGSRPLFTSVKHDLRIPGVLLSSFVQFAGSYYAEYKVDQPSSSALNRHAIIHCSSDCWTTENATKLLTFFDLTIRLERVLRIVIHGPMKKV